VTLFTRQQKPRTAITPTYPTDRAHNITCEKAFTTKNSLQRLHNEMKDTLLYECFTKTVTKLLRVYRGVRGL